MKVYIEKEDRTVDISKGKNCTGIELLKELHINPATVILVRNREVILDDELLSDADDIQILSVISGG